MRENRLLDREIIVITSGHANHHIKQIHICGMIYHPLWNKLSNNIRILNEYSEEKYHKNTVFQMTDDMFNNMKHKFPGYNDNHDILGTPV